MAERAANSGHVMAECGKAAAREGARREWDEESLGDVFMSNLDRSLQLSDPWGKYADLSRNERISKLFLCTPAQKTELMSGCRILPVLRTQVSVLFQAVAASLEKVSGDLVQSMVEMNEEGFGRALVYSGRTVLVVHSIRGGVPFPFAEHDKLRLYGISCIREGLKNRERFRQLQLSPFS
ncbi:DUF269 domain-containing protein [Paenibacillus faecis]|nr:DUF269 domain-containing protein [Paenibacillus faecis]